MATVTQSAGTHPTFRRSVTVPTRLQQRPSTDQLEDAFDEDAGGETLFVHPAAKVVSFTAPGAFKHGQDIGTLPWSSRSERVISAGPLRLYRLRSHVSYLHSGSVVLSLLPRSQCWCVDGESMFAMRIQGLVYRIELPCSNDEDREKVEGFIKVLKEILSYESTPCPFKRGFTVEVPNELESPRHRRLIGPYRKAKSWEFDDVWKRGSPAKSPRNITATSSPEFSDDEEKIVEKDETTITMPGAIQNAVSGEETKPPIRPRAVDAPRSVTAPVQLAYLLARSDSEPTADFLEVARDSFDPEPIELPESFARHMAEPDTQSYVEQINMSTTDSIFTPPHATFATTTPSSHLFITPTFYPDTHFVENPENRSHTRDSSEITITPLTARLSRKNEFGESILPTSSQNNNITSAISSDGFQNDIAAPLPTASWIPAFDVQSIAVSTLHQQQPPHEPTPPSLYRKDYYTNTYNTAPYNTTPYTFPRTSPTHRDDEYLITRTFNLLMGPPSGLITIVKEVAARVFNSAPSDSITVTGGATNQFYRLRRVRLPGLPGRWEDSESESVASATSLSVGSGPGSEEDEWGDEVIGQVQEGDEEEGEVTMRMLPERQNVKEMEIETEGEEEDDYGVPLANDTPARRKRKVWGWGTETHGQNTNAGWSGSGCVSVSDGDAWERA